MIVAEVESDPFHLLHRERVAACEYQLPCHPTVSKPQIGLVAIGSLAGELHDHLGNDQLYR
jgi:hypothetical protein